MRKLKTLFALLVLSFFTIGQVWGAPQKFLFSSYSSGTVTDSQSKTWSASGSIGSSELPADTTLTSAASRGVGMQAANTTITSSTEFSNVTSVRIDYSYNKTVSAAYQVFVGNTQIGSDCSFSAKKNHEKQNFTSATPLSGAIQIKLKTRSQGTVWIGAVTVVTSSGSTTEPTLSLTPANMENLDAEGAGEQAIKVKCANFGSNIAINTAFFDNAACSGEAISTPAWITNFTKTVPTTASTDTTITFSVANNDGAARETWLRVDASDGTKKDTTILHISQKLYVAPLATMDAIFAKAKEVKGTATDVRIAFDNWVITGVNGAEAFVTDGTKGFRIYKSSHGFNVGDKLSGTVACQVKLYTGVAQVSEITSTSDGLTVTPNTEIIPVVKTISDLDSINTGALVTIKDVTYKSSTTSFVDAEEKSIAPSSTFYSGSFTNNIKYNVTGIFQSYSGAKRILPRSADDIYSVPVVTTTVSSLSFEAKQNNAVAGKKFSLTGVSLKGNLTITASEGFSVDKESITPTAAGAVAATEITVTPATPTTTTTPVEGTVTISSEGLEDIVINLSMTVTPTVAVTVAVSPAGKGTATINGLTTAYVADGDVFELVAEANDPTKYEFAGWTVAAADEEHIDFTNASLATTTAMVDAALTITANFDSITTPSMTVSVEKIDFDEVDVKSVQTGVTFTITGAHLEDAITLALNAEMDDDFTFEVTDGSLTPDEQEKTVSATVRVKPVTDVAGDFVGQLIVSSNNLTVGNDTIDLFVTVNKLAANISWTASEAEAIIGEENELPTLNNARKLTVVYSSTETSVATIDASTGAITLVAAGTTQILANFAGNDTVNAVAENTIYYTLTVKEKFAVKWYANKELIETTYVLTGEKITAHAAPDPLDSKYVAKSFIGWVPAELKNATDVQPTLVDFTDIDAADTTFYALYATVETGDPSVVLSEDFSSISDGNSTSSSGSSSAWTINSNFSSSSKVYKAGGAVRVGKPGSLETKTLNLSAGVVTVAFKLKGWSSTENVVSVQVDDQTAQNDTCESYMDQGNFESKSLTFAKGTTTSTVVFSTTSSMRVFLDDIVISVTSEIRSAYVTTVPTIPTALDNTDVSVKAVKVLREGQIFILRGDKVYTVQGQLVK